MPFFLALLSLLVTSAPAWAARQPFPVGIYDVQTVAQLPILQENGFDAFEPRSSNPSELAVFAKAARERGMQMLPMPGGVIASTWSAQARQWPVLAWYLVDEPDVHHWQAEKLAALNRQVKAWSPAQQTLLVIGSGSPAERFGACADIVMMDWYPVPHLPLSSVAEQIDAAHRLLPPGKRLWVVLQAFDWRDAPQHHIPPIGRFPTRDEIRFMTYLALVHDAKGIFYYTLLKPGGKTLLDFPEQFEDVAYAARELHALKAVLERGRPVVAPFSSPDKWLEEKAWSYAGRTYVILVNRSNDAMGRVHGAFHKPDWTSLSQNTRDSKVPVTKKDGAWFLQPHQVLILKSL